MLELQNIALDRGANRLFSAANARLHPGQRVGLVGKNGSGKSSLFALLRGEIDAAAGEVLLPDSWLVASVKQETPSAEISALDYVLDGHQRYRQISQQLAEAETAQDGAAIAKAHDELLSIDGYALPARAAELLTGLGFTQALHHQAVKRFSGGWRMRLNLAQALIAPADLLLLDEPTNHLDLETVLWLQSYLQHHPATQLIIAHDRGFLDALCQSIWHIEQQTLTTYRGNYSDFEHLRAQSRQQQASHYQQSLRQRAHLESYIERFRAKASKARQAQSRLKALEKLHAQPPPPDEESYHFKIAPAKHYPNPALRLEHASIGHTQNPILHDITFSLQSNSRIGLLGANGTGKTTFLRTLAGDLPLLAGTRTLHPHSKIAYFTQHQSDKLVAEQSPMAHLAQCCPDWTSQSQRDFLGRFGFGGDKALAPVAPFSGGEKTRLALALAIAQHPNILLLDEPTNHLDMAMRDALCQALTQYEGALVIISHDAHLLESSCDQFFIMQTDGLNPFDGDLDDYHQWLKQGVLTANKEISSASNAHQQKQLRKRLEAERRQQLQPLKKQIADEEKQLDALNKQLVAMEKTLSDPAIYEAEQKAHLTELLHNKGKLTQALEQCEQRWLSLSEALFDAENAPLE